MLVVVGAGALVGAVWHITGRIERAKSELRREIGECHDRISRLRETVEEKYARRDDMAVIAARIEGRLENLGKTVSDAFTRLDQRIDDWIKESHRNDKGT